MRSKSRTIKSLFVDIDMIAPLPYLIKSFDNATVSWSVNTLDENFRRDMDRKACQ